MRRDPTEFRKRFALYKLGKSPYKNGRPAEAPEVVITPDYEYNLFLNTLPDNQRLTPEEEYTTHKYWELHNKPKDFQEALKQGMYHFDASDNSYHANSIAYDKNGTGYFMKPDSHPTVKYELDYYNKGLITEEGGIQRLPTKSEFKDLLNFRKEYKLISDPDRPGFHKYERRVNVPKFDTGYTPDLYPKLSSSDTEPQIPQQPNFDDFQYLPYLAEQQKFVDDLKRELAVKKEVEDLKNKYRINNTTFQVDPNLVKFSELFTKQPDSKIGEEANKVIASLSTNSNSDKLSNAIQHAKDKQELEQKEAFSKKKYENELIANAAFTAMSLYTGWQALTKGLGKGLGYLGDQFVKKGITDKGYSLQNTSRNWLGLANQHWATANGLGLASNAYLAFKDDNVLKRYWDEGQAGADFLGVIGATDKLRKLGTNGSKLRAIGTGLDNTFDTFGMIGGLGDFGEAFWNIYNTYKYIQQLNLQQDYISTTDYNKGKTPLHIPKFDSGIEPYTPYNKSIVSDLGNGTILLPAGYSFTYGFNPDAPTGQQSGMYIYKSDDPEHTPVEFKPIIQSNDPDKARSDYWGNVGRDYMYHGMNTGFGKTMQNFANLIAGSATGTAIAGSGALKELTRLFQSGSGAIGSAVKSAISNPIYQNAAKLLLTSTIGGESVNLGSRALTGRTIGENVADLAKVDKNSGWRLPTELIGEFLNPGYLLSPNKVFNSYDKITSGISTMNSNISNYFDNLVYNKLYKLDNINDRLQAIKNEKERYVDLISGLNDRLFESQKIVTGVRGKLNRSYQDKRVNFNKMNDELLKRYFEKRLQRLKDQFLNDSQFATVDVLDGLIKVNRTSKPQNQNYDWYNFKTGENIKGLILETVPELNTTDVYEMPYPPDNATNKYLPYMYLRESISNNDQLLTPPKISKDLLQVILDNINYVKEILPSFKASGSGAMSASGQYTGIPGDIDGWVIKTDIENAIKRGADIVKVGDRYLLRIKGDASTPQQLVDLDVLDSAPGQSVDRFTSELIRLQYPKFAEDEAISNAVKFNGTPTVNKTNVSGKQLLENVDESILPIIDSIETRFDRDSRKAKAAERLFYYMRDADPNNIHKALLISIELLTGGRGHLLPELKFGTPENNLKLLEELGYPKSIAKYLASDSKKMQNAVDYWYIADRTTQRATNAGNLNNGNRSIKNLYRNATTWNADPTTNGGSNSGAGLNTVIGGDSGHHRAIYVHSQPNVQGLTEGMPAEEAVNLINNTYGIGNNFTSDAAKALYNKYGIDFSTYVDKPLNLILKDADVIRNKNIWNDLLKLTNTKGIAGNIYEGLDLYFGSGDLTPDDIMGFTAGDAMKYEFLGIPSLRTRSLYYKNKKEFVPPELNLSNSDRYYTPTAKFELNTDYNFHSNKIEKLNNVIDLYKQKLNAARNALCRMQMKYNQKESLANDLRRNMSAGAKATTAAGIGGGSIYTLLQTAKNTNQVQRLYNKYLESDYAYKYDEDDPSWEDQLKDDSAFVKFMYDKYPRKLNSFVREGIVDDYMLNHSGLTKHDILDRVIKQSKANNATIKRKK